MRHTVKDLNVYGTNGCDPYLCDAADFLDFAKHNVKLNDSAALQLQALYADEVALPGELLAERFE